MKYQIGVFIFAVFLLFCTGAYAQDISSLSGDDHESSVVYFTEDISSDGLMKVYRALEQQITGKVGIKVSFGGPGEQYLNPELLSGLVNETGGTLIDSNGLSGNRWTSAMNYAIADVHGFSDIGQIQILDEQSDISMPVSGGFLLDHVRTGSHFDDYETLISVHRFKFHYIEAMGGNIKNISLCLASKAGKNLIHSGGKDADRYHNTDPDVLARSFADAAKAATEYKKNWAFINVLDSFEPDDHCSHTSNIGNVGIIASLDVVALDQCSLDFILARSDAEEAVKQDWMKYHQTNVLEYAEELGIGKRAYRLVNLDSHTVN